MNIKKVFSLAALMALSCAALSSASTASDAPDYSNKACWQKLPNITKDVDTFYIYATEYMGLGEGDTAYAALDNEEMVKGAEEQYMIQASAYEAASNVFVPYYRQAGMRVMKKAWLETGDVNAAISGMPYSDITSALDYYFKHYNN
ncbi:MAG: DUF3089 domain-containing protein, partial [Synergistaceae bacterium]|nr:DUF3089 domain-containing protein [Synergistaceae bacterium]